MYIVFTYELIGTDSNNLCLLKFMLTLTKVLILLGVSMIKTFYHSSSTRSAVPLENYNQVLLLLSPCLLVEYYDSIVGKIS